MSYEKTDDYKSIDKKRIRLKDELDIINNMLIQDIDPDEWEHFIKLRNSLLFQINLLKRKLQCKKQTGKLNGVSTMMEQKMYRSTIS
jgi:hypothetical protein